MQPEGCRLRGCCSWSRGSAPALDHQQLFDTAGIGKAYDLWIFSSKEEILVGAWQNTVAWENERIASCLPTPHADRAGGAGR